MAITPAGPEQQLMPIIRAEVRERIERTSLRAVARDIGITASGLLKFAAGSQPYRKTIRKLEAWYLRQPGRTPERGESPSADTVAAAIRILALLPPAARRGEFVDAILKQVNEAAPQDRAWRQEFSRYDEYLRAGGPDGLPELRAEELPRRRRRRRRHESPPPE
jgi:hypothetical protein